MSSLNSIGQSVFEVESGNGNVDGQTNGHKMDKQAELHQFERNLAMMVIYLPVKLNSIGQSIFESESGNVNVDGQTDKKRTNKQTELHQFERNLAMMVIYLPVKFEFDWTKCFRVRVRKRKC